MELSRREAIVGAGALALAAAAAGAQDDRRVVKKGKIKQSVARWCFGKIPLPELAKACAEMGMAGIDLLKPEEWKVAKDHGLVCTTALVGAGSIAHGLNDKKHHETILRAFEENIPKAAAEGVPNVIVMFGNRVAGMSDAEAVDNSVECLNKAKGIAEANKVTIVIEILNSKVDHKGYIGDNTPYCLKVIKAVNSPYVKLLYDIYHAQIMEGDVIRTIQNEHQWIGHYHTGGNPGRGEIDDSQELNYVAITRAVIKTGFTGYYAHEFIPKRPDPLKSLREAVALCDVE
jgi:hydroxypyruvate isomerase